MPYFPAPHLRQGYSWKDGTLRAWCFSLPSFPKKLVNWTPFLTWCKTGIFFNWACTEELKYRSAQNLSPSSQGPKGLGTDVNSPVVWGEWLSCRTTSGLLGEHRLVLLVWYLRIIRFCLYVHLSLRWTLELPILPVIQGKNAVDGMLWVGLGQSPNRKFGVLNLT